MQVRRYKIMMTKNSKDVYYEKNDIHCYRVKELNNTEKDTK